MISTNNEMIKADWNVWAINLLKFTAPTLAVFFGQLAAGVKCEIALPIALLALYGAVADWFKKYKNINHY